jgi:hypothetical protein
MEQMAQKGTRPNSDGILVDGTSDVALSLLSTTATKALANG